MQFVDQVDITVEAGDGGNGIVALRREKFVPRGGPSGGDGGRGGSVIIQADAHLGTLVDLRYKKNYKAARGGNGGPNDRHGKDGEDLIIKVPVGTLVYHARNSRLMADLAADGTQFVAGKGGEGGRGNASFATSTMQTPRFAEKGEPAEQIPLTLELKLLADVGLIGYPNVGKSTLISRISAAKPKIADYPFTTLVPNLGVVKIDNRSFVVADMPGLIDGAHEGAGLGHVFLRHIERTRLLVHLIDVSGLSEREAIADFDSINEELHSHSEKLAALPQMVALNKVDMPQAGEIVQALAPRLKERGLEVHEISALTGQGIQQLVYNVADRLDQLPKELVEVQQEVVRFTIEPERDKWQARKLTDGRFIVKGRPVEVLVARTDTSNEYALRRMHRRLDKMGVIKRLRELGAQHGDTVMIRDMEFDFHDEAYA